MNETAGEYLDRLEDTQDKVANLEAALATAQAQVAVMVGYLTRCQGRLEELEPREQKLGFQRNRAGMLLATVDEALSAAPKVVWSGPVEIQWHEDEAVLVPLSNFIDPDDGQGFNVIVLDKGEGE